MPDCPHCFHELEESRSGGVSWQCPDCGGLLATLPFLRRRLSVEAANRIWQTARESEPGTSPRQCPFCEKDMVRIHSEFDGRDIELDACLPCQAFWFDRGEIEALPEAPPPPPPEPEPELSEETREKVAAVKMAMIRAQADCETPDHDGETAGLPFPDAFPWATLLILVLFIVEWLATPRVRVHHDSNSRVDRAFWCFLIVLVWQFWPLGSAAEAELGGGGLLTLWAVSTLVAAVVHFVAGCDTSSLFLPLAMESLLGILVWLALRFPWGRIASSINRNRYGPLVRFWCPLSLVATLWGVACVCLPSMLNLEAPGSVAATLAAAGVGFCTRRFRRDTRRLQRGGKARREDAE